MDIPESDETLEPKEDITEVGETSNLAKLTPDVVPSILWRLGWVEVIMTAQHVCSTWGSICREPFMWRHLDMRILDDFLYRDYDHHMLFRTAVDLSQGGLESITIGSLGTDDLLHYVAERSRSLKHLRLVSCNNISDDGLTAVATQMPLLEELEFSFCSFSREALEVMGRCCPRIKSFKLNCEGCIHLNVESDEEALAIAQNMPNLVHLQIFGNKLTNAGLQAILDGCLHLESLDLHQCFNVDLNGDLEKICANRIKDLRHPFDRTLLRRANFGSSSGGYPSG